MTDPTPTPGTPTPTPPPAPEADDSTRQRARIERLFRHIDPADAATRRLLALVQRFRQGEPLP